MIIRAREVKAPNLSDAVNFDYNIVSCRSRFTSSMSEERRFRKIGEDLLFFLNSREIEIRLSFLRASSSDR